jgi:6-phosphogluconolactonase (cycloisomerase 2 family)
MSTGGIYAYKFDPMSGSITAVAGSPFATDTGGDRDVAMSRDAKFLYSIKTADGSLVGFSIQADGALAAVPGSPFATSEPISNIVTNPSADYLYAVAYSGDLKVYSIDSSTGALTEQTADAVPAVFGWPLVITPDGQRLYQISDQVYGFSIDGGSGALKALPGSPFAVFAMGGGIASTDATIDPSGRFIYATNGAEFTGFGGPMYIGSIDPQTGAVSPVTPFSPTNGPQWYVAVDASGKYAVVTTGVTSKTGPNCFAVQSIDATSGMLTAVPGSPFPGPFSNGNGNCGPLLADPSGSYIYMGSGGVSVYSLDETTGVPQRVTGSTLDSMDVQSLAVTH